MITLFLNGQAKVLSADLSIADLLASLQLDPTHLAIALNDEVIPKSELGKIFIHDLDHLEIIRPAGGG
jgi:sulfur carrier protein